LEKQLKREQRCLSRKYKALKKREIKGKEKATRQNIQKQILRIQRIHKKLADIRSEYINQCINEIVKTKLIQDRGSPFDWVVYIRQDAIPILMEDPFLFN